ncbi:AMP-dependent synthetase/ligase [Penicillium italicum]|uniref:AMP-dependent synthetase/ligase n=1 Tax=Penicillium italicum TaxID=40296 RepID=A0A0A2L481_PENIT|nr:AMP-dependent synthetase/ligase [Penicillium italicum]
MGLFEQSDDIALWPTTSLPLFNTTVGTAAVRSYHEVTAHAIPIPSNSHALLQRFARFILAVTGRTDVAFIADDGCEQALFRATTASGDEVELTKTSSNAFSSDVSGLDFGIYAPASPDSTNNSLTKLLQPLVASLRPTDEGVADITLFLRGSHGPQAAARHLLQLATSYINPHPSLHKTEISQIYAPLPQHPLQNGHGSPVLLHNILEHAARSYPHNIAIDEVTGGRTGSYTRCELTYVELNAKVSSFADEIQAVLQKLDWPAFQGGQKMVPIFLGNSAELNICMNAISKAGHAFCPLQIDAPEERLRDLLFDLQAPGILGVGSNPWAGTEFGKDIIWIDYFNPTACLQGQPPPTYGPVLAHRTPSENDIAYIMYTSGSTGKPKGVVMQHRVAISFLQNMDAGPAPLPTGPRLRWIIMSAPTFDIVLMDNFMAPLKGGTICIAERQLLLTNPEAVVRELRATATFTVNSLAMLLRPERVPTLTWIAVGGELVGQRVVDNFAPKAGEEKPSRLMICGYGPTEATVFVSNHVCDDASRPSVIGEPLPGMQLIVLDMESSERRVVPLGVAGELAIGGPQLSTGYLNNPKETAQAFVQDEKFGRLYRTGDKVRVVWSESGEPRVEFLGRISTDQVKLNGRRVELPEIENVLSRADGAARVAVLVSKSKLVACVMPWEDATNKDSVVALCRAEAEKYLPAWMRPLQYLAMNKLPLSPNGKVDRRALASILSPTEAAATPVAAKVTLIPDVVDHTIASEKSTASGYDSAIELDTPIDAASIVYGGLVDAIGEEVQEQDHSATLVHLGLDSLSALVFLQTLGELGITELEIQDVLDTKTIGDLIGKVEKLRPKGKTDTASIIYKGLVDALGEDVHQQDRSIVLAELGMDSLGALVFLQTLGEFGITHLEIHEVLASNTIGDLIDTVDKQRVKEALAAAPVVVHEYKPEPSFTPARLATTAAAPDGIDVTVIAADDAEEVFELPVEAKLRHFDHHCRAQCLAALKLNDEQVEQVLPVTNVQARFVALGIDPEYYDTTKYVGRPQMTHFVYKIPEDLDPARLQRAVDTVLPRYDCFRTVFVSVEHPVAPFAQCILSPSVARIPRTEVVCDDTDAEDRNSLWSHTINGIQRAAEASMSIDKPGLSVAWVWSPNRARCVMILSMFHGVYDGTQINFLFDAVLAEYAKPGSTPPMDLLPIQTAVELNLGYDWIQTVMYWAGRLAGVPGSRLGERRPVPRALLPNAAPGFAETHMRSVSVKASLTMRQLSKAAQAMSTNMLTVAEAAWASVLAQTFADTIRADAIAGKKSFDVQFGTVLNGRRHQDALRCMAPMLAALPQRLVIDGTKRLTNREACSLLAAHRIEAQPFLQMPCPTLAHARMGTDRFDSVLLVQALTPEEVHNPLRQLPGFNFDENLMAPFKEIDVGFPLTTELWPGSLQWDEKMLIRCAYSRARHEFLTHDWVHGALSALDEAILRITSEPDALFYIG